MKKQHLMKKQYLTEIKRLQKLAGLLNENEGEDDYNYIRSEVDVDRKPYDVDEIYSQTDFNDLSPKIKKMISSLPIIEINEEDFGEDLPISDNVQFLMLKIKDDYYFVDTQGFSYIRYAGKILNFPQKSLNENENEGGFVTFEEIKQAVIASYKDVADNTGGEEEDYPNDELSSLEECKNIDDLLSILDGLGYNGDEAYDYILDVIIKKQTYSKLRKLIREEITSEFQELKKQQAAIKNQQNYLIKISNDLKIDRKLIGDYNEALNTLLDAIFKASYNK